MNWFLLIAGLLLVVGLIFSLLQILRTPQFRKAIVQFLDAEAYKTAATEDLTLSAKAAIYDQISGLSRARAIRVLNDIVRELVVGDPKLSTTRVQMVVPDLAKIAEKLSSSEFMFLLSSAIDQSAYNQLLAGDRTPG